MRDAIQEIPEAMSKGIDPITDIRKAAKMMVDIAMDNYTDDLLKSAFNMVHAVVQFANDLEGDET